MSLLGILLVLILLFWVFGSFPNWNHSRTWGYGPSLAGVVVLVLVLFLIFGGGLGHVRL